MRACLTDNNALRLHAHQVDSGDCGIITASQFSPSHWRHRLAETHDILVD
jgi:hypothetical protein